MRTVFVVCDNYGNALAPCHYDDTPRGGVLLCGKAGKAYASHKAAYQAYLRTKFYADDKGLKWECHRWRINAVKVPS